MATYLLTWNPKRWQWNNLQESITLLERQGYYEDTWSCGRNTKIVKGDRLFLIRLGTEPKGICGSGWVTSKNFFEYRHWDKQKRQEENEPATFNCILIIYLIQIANRFCQEKYLSMASFPKCTGTHKHRGFLFQMKLLMNSKKCGRVSWENLMQFHL